MDTEETLYNNNITVIEGVSFNYLFKKSYKVSIFIAKQEQQPRRCGKLKQLSLSITGLIWRNLAATEIWTPGFRAIFLKTRLRVFLNLYHVVLVFINNGNGK